MGDFNINVFKPHCLHDIFEVNGEKNLVKVPTCHKSETPTSIDLVLSNVHKRIQNVTCFDKISNTSQEKTISYRSYKHFENDKYLYDLVLATCVKSSTISTMLTGLVQRY